MHVLTVLAADAAHACEVLCSCQPGHTVQIPVLVFAMTSQNYLHQIMCLSHRDVHGPLDALHHVRVTSSADLPCTMSRFLLLSPLPAHSSHHLRAWPGCTHRVLSAKRGAMILAVQQVPLPPISNPRL
jgi:hypothetical protein